MFIICQALMGMHSIYRRQLVQPVANNNFLVPSKQSKLPKTFFRVFHLVHQNHQN